MCYLCKKYSIRDSIIRTSKRRSEVMFAMELSWTMLCHTVPCEVMRCYATLMLILILA